MRSNILIALMLSLVLCFSSFANAEQNMPMGYTIGDTIEDFSVVASDGTTYTLSELLATHDAVLINIWGSWCTPCCMELPYLQEAFEIYGDNVAFLCLSAFDSNEDIEAFKAENGLTTLPMAYDTTGLSEALVTEGYPTTIIVDRFGVYVNYECGGLPNADAVAQLFTPFLGEDYHESIVVSDKVANRPDADAPDGDALKAALYPEGDIDFATGMNGEAWPFVVTDGGVRSSNIAANTYSEIEAAVSVQAGDVITFDYSMSASPIANVLTLIVDDQRVAAFTGNVNDTYAYRFDTAGDHVFYWLFTVADPVDTDGVTISNVRLLSGADADAAIATMPVYPRTLEGTKIRIVPEGEGVRRIVFNDPTGTIQKNFGDSEFYFVPGDKTRVHIEIGSEVMPTMTYVMGDYDYEIISLTDCDKDDTGYSCDISLADVASGDRTNTYIIAQSDNALAVTGVWTDEQALDRFCAEEVTDKSGTLIEGITWSYADGETADSEAGERTYTITVTDENGAPVEGVMLNICTEFLCLTGSTDANGVHSFTGENYPYTIHVVVVPDGYDFDTEREFVMDDTDLAITVPHA